MRKWMARRREAKLRPLASQWSYDRGYAQGRADMADAQARCRRPAHLNYNTAPLATVCDDCHALAFLPPPVIPLLDKDTLWDAHVSQSLELVDAPPFPMVGDTWMSNGGSYFWSGLNWERRNG